MQTSRFHKDRGDLVELYSPLFEYDQVYVYSLFTFTKKPRLKANMIAGGTGFNVHSQLPEAIANSDLDYSICEGCEASYLWFSRGCFRNCPFCVVPTKEGLIHAVKPKNLNENGKYIAVMDNNFFGNKTWKDAIQRLRDINEPVDFQCGFDARIWSEEQGQAIGELKHYRQIRTAWDDPRQDLRSKLQEMADQLGKSRIMVYVLIGFWSTPEEDLYRVTEIRKIGLDPWIMPYNKKDPYQKAFERWVNHHVNCEWQDYKYGSWSKEEKKPRFVGWPCSVSFSSSPETAFSESGVVLSRRGFSAKRPTLLEGCGTRKTTPVGQASPTPFSLPKEHGLRKHMEMKRNEC